MNKVYLNFDGVQIAIDVNDLSANTLKEAKEKLSHLGIAIPNHGYSFTMYDRLEVVN